MKTIAVTQSVHWLGDSPKKVNQVNIANEIQNSMAWLGSAISSQALKKMTFSHLCDTSLVPILLAKEL